MVPLFDNRRQHAPIESELCAAFLRVLRSGQFILGPEVQAFEDQVRQFTNARHALGVSSGTDAILLALMTLNIGPGDEVLCPSFTFFATAGCIARVGATPVFVDCCPCCFNLDVQHAATLVSPRTKAIIPVHLFGQTAAMDKVAALADAHGLAVIEDAAQALGAEFGGRKAGSIGTFGTFSFFPTKNLGGFGDAGMLVTNDDALAERARLLRTHGARQKYFHEAVGGNFRLDALQAALLAIKLPLVSQYDQKRCQNAHYYTERLGRLPGVAISDLTSSTCLQVSTEKNPQNEVASQVRRREAIRLILPAAYPHNLHIWNQYTIRVTGVGQRDRLRRHLADRGVGAEVYYPVPLHRQECFSSFDRQATPLPVSELVASECLSLPVFPELQREQLEEVTGALEEFFGQAESQQGAFSSTLEGLNQSRS